MVNLFLAEWKKIIGNTKLMVSLVWLFPIMTAISLGIGIVISLFSEGFGAFMGRSEWTKDILGIWGIVTNFPGSVFTRLPLIAFMAMVFAGEYESGTWKNIIPRNNRVNIIVAKLVAVVANIMVALVITSIITVIMQYFSHAVEKVAYGPTITSDTIYETLRAYLISSSLTLISLFILGTFAAISAMLTRSVLGSLLLSFGLSLADLLSIMLFLLLGNLFNKPEILNGFQFTPSYNIDNIRSWLLNNVASDLVPPGFTAELGPFTSFTILVIWIIALLALALWLFNRPDITS